MSEGKLAMFGKTFNTVGSTESNLILKTKGDLKILWGGKFIDLIKNGKIVSNLTNLLKIISNLDLIDGNGIYLISTEKGSEVWVSIDGTNVNIAGDLGTTYVSFLTELKDITVDLKYRALSNVGFYYESLEKALSAGLLTGIIFITGENKLYTVKGGIIAEYILGTPSESEEGSKYFEELTIGELRIYKDGSIMNIDSSTLLFWINDLLVLNMGNSILSYSSLEMKDGTYILSEGATKDSGFRLYKADGKSILDIDTINLRGDLNRLSYIDVTYLKLILLIEDSELVIGKEYKLKDFQNSWEANTETIYEDIYDKESNTLISLKNVRPIILKARSKNTLELNSYFFDNPEWILHYDYTINGEIQITDGETGLPTLSTEKGRIVYLKDEYNNEANYDFKHLLFQIDDKWYYTFSNGEEDASLDGNYMDNVVNIKDFAIANKNFVLSGTNKLVFLTPVLGNKFKNFEGITTIEGDFNNNTIYSEWANNTISTIINNCEFLGNVSDTNFTKSLTDCSFKSTILSTDIFTKVELNNCLVNSTILNIIESPDETLVNNLKSLEPKLIVVVIRDSKQYLSITSDTLLSIPSGAILMWAGTKDVPYGWTICDGKNGTPNLLGRFIKAVSTLDEVGEISSELNDNNELTLKLENLPKHNHPHLAHTHEITLGSIDAIAEKSGSLDVLLEDNDYNFGIGIASKTVITSVTGEGVTSETTTVDGVTNIKTKGGISSGGDHSHTVKIDASGKASLKESTSKEIVPQDAAWPNKAIKIEPRAYALIFIMKL